MPETKLIDTNNTLTLIEVALTEVACSVCHELITVEGKVKSLTCDGCRDLG